MLASGPGNPPAFRVWTGNAVRFGSRPVQKPDQHCLGGVVTKTRPNTTVFGWVLHTAEPHFRELRTLGPIKYLSCDWITIWYIHIRCSFAYSFTSDSPLCDPISIHRVTGKNAQLLALFHHNSTNIDQIAKWRLGGERACKTASITYIWYCDTIRTQIHNRSQISEFAKRWNRPNNRGFSAVHICDRVKPVESVPVWFEPGPRTEPRIWNRC